MKLHDPCEQQWIAQISLLLPILVELAEVARCALMKFHYMSVIHIIWNTHVQHPCVSLPAQQMSLGEELVGLGYKCRFPRRSNSQKLFSLTVACGSHRRSTSSPSAQ